MGLDVGTKTIGVSVSDELGWTAQGVEVIRRHPRSIDADIERLNTLINEYDVHNIVVGWPRNMDGSVGPKAAECEQFAKHVQQETGIPCQLWDERLTTVAAERMLIQAGVRRSNRKNVIDKTAAVLILQSFLDAKP